MIYAWPKNEKLWDEYSRLRADGLRAGDDGAAATEFYRKNRAAMDAGAEVAWPARYNPDELSALQHAVNLRLRDGEKPGAMDVSDLITLVERAVAERRVL